MTGREKILAAMSPEGTASTPVVLCYPELFMRDCWEKVTPVPWWAMFSQDIELAVQAHRDMLAVTGEDRVRLWMSAPRADRQRYRVEGVDAKRARRIDTATGRVEELFRPPPGGFVSPQDRGWNDNRAYSSREQIDQALPVPPVETADSLAADGRLDKPRRTLQEFGRDRMPWTQLPSPWDPLSHLWGFEGLMLACVDRPDLVEYACQRVVRCNLSRLATWKAAGVELIWIEDCGGDHISPDLYRRFVLPPLKELTSAIRREGLRSIQYYTGNANDRLELLLQGGADALSLEESRKGFIHDIVGIAEQVDGRMALLGNLDAYGVLERGPRQAIVAEVKRQLQAGRRNGNRFIMGIGSPITPNTPMDHVRCLAQAVGELAP